MNLGSRIAVATAFKRHKAAGTIRILGCGPDDVPRVHTVLGTLRLAIEWYHRRWSARTGCGFSPRAFMRPPAGPGGRQGGADTDQPEVDHAAQDGGGGQIKRSPDPGVSQPGRRSLHAAASCVCARVCRQKSAPRCYKTSRRHLSGCTPLCVRWPDHEYGIPVAAGGKPQLTLSLSRGNNPEVCGLHHRTNVRIFTAKIN